GGQCSRRHARVERQRHWKNIGESDAVQKMKRNQPTDWNFHACASSDGRASGKRKKTGYRNNTADADLGNLGWLRIFLRPASTKDNRSGKTAHGQDRIEVAEACGR